MPVFNDNNDGGEALCRKALAIQQQVYGTNSSELIFTKEFLASILTSYAFHEDEPIFREILETCRSSTNVDLVFSTPENKVEFLPEKKNGLPYQIGVMESLENLLRKQGRTNESSLLRKERLDMASMQTDPYDRAAGIARSIMSLHAEGRYAEAEPLARELFELNTKTRGATQFGEWYFGSSKAFLGSTLVGLKKYDEAENLLVSAYEEMKVCKLGHRDDGTADARMEETLNNLVNLFQTIGKKDRVEHYQKELAELKR